MTLCISEGHTSSAATYRFHSAMDLSLISWQLHCQSLACYCCFFDSQMIGLVVPMMVPNNNTTWVRLSNQILLHHSSA